MSEQEIKIIQEKIDKGLEWSYEKMLKEKASRNENMVISRNTFSQLWKVLRPIARR